MALLAMLPTTAEANNTPHSDLVSTTAATFTPNLVSTGYRPIAYSINQAGSSMIVGGRFDRVENSARTVQYNRKNVFAFDATTGAVSPAFDPNVDGQVWSVLGNGDDVYIAGEFENVDGVARPSVAKLSLSTGQLDTNFNPKVAGGRITDLELSHGLLFMSGAFNKKLQAVDPDTGAASSYFDNVTFTDPLQYTTRTEVFRFDVSPDGQHLVAVGNFQTISGMSQYRVAMVDLGANSATASSWHYEPSDDNCHAATIPIYQYYIKDVDFSPNSQFFTLASTGGYRVGDDVLGLNLCDSTARFSVSDLSPSQPVWINYTGADSLHSVIDTGGAIYVQGHSRWLSNPYGGDSPADGEHVAPGGGAMNPATGDALFWPVDMSAKTGGYQMFSNDQGVWFATDSKLWNGKYHMGIRLAPVVPAGQTTTPAKTNYALGKSATQSSQYEFARADLAVDGFTMGNLHLGSVSHTWNDPQPWWQVDLGATTRIGVIKVFNRTDCCADRLHDWTVSVLDANNQVVWSSTQASQAANVTSINTGGVNGRYVKVQLNHSDFLQLAEVQVFGKN
jgi:hypothetical protein